MSKTCEKCIHYDVCRYPVEGRAYPETCWKYEEQRPHGEWTIRKRYTKEGHDDGHGLYCSECDTHLITLSNRGLTLEEAREYLQDHIEKNKFCFNCGADMRGKGKAE